MKHTFLRRGAILFVLFCFTLLDLQADQLKGKIQSISNKAKTIQLLVPSTNAVEVIRFGPQTRYINAKSIKEFIPNDLILVDFQPGREARSIKRVLIQLSPQLLISTKEVEQLLQSKTPYTLIDARPTSRYNEGFIPGAISIPVELFQERIQLLPKDKNQRIVYYCGGPTCGLSPKSAALAKKAGYKNIKVYQDGLPGWKKAGQLVHRKASTIAKELGPNTVIVDLRPVGVSSKAHLPGAVAITLAEIETMTKNFTTPTAQRKNGAPLAQRILPGLKDKKAPIVLYADADRDPVAVKAFAHLTSWGYKKVALLEGGFSGWAQSKLSTEVGVPKSKIVYVKRLVPGAIAPDDFIKMAMTGGVILDVRNSDEVKSGVIQNSIHIPLGILENHFGKVPRDKPVAIHCKSGARAEIAYNILKKRGYTQAFYLNANIDINSKGQFTID